VCAIGHIEIQRKRTKNKVRAIEFDGGTRAMLRVGLFLITNLGILLVLSVVLHLTGVDQTLASQGVSSLGALIFAAVFGMGGAFISLAMSKFLAKRSMGLRIVSEPRGQMEIALVRTVQRLAKSAGIGMPEVAVFESPTMNAFATGMSRNQALVAVSTGLLRGMDADELEAVLGHEISHVANGDMVTLTLIQGVLNTFVIFLSRIVGSIVDRTIFGNRRGGGVGYFITVIAAQIVLGVLASVVVMWFSRWREFRADAGGARLAGRSKMIKALQRLQAGQPPEAMPDSLAAFGVNAGEPHGLRRLLMSHPPLQARIEALRHH